MGLAGYVSFVLIFFVPGMCLTTTSLLAQDYASEIKGTPRIIHYTKKDFLGDSQFWGMTQDHDGLLYFGNNDGAVVFDGESWQKVQLPNNSSIRSLKVSLNGTIYVGGFNEFGIIRRDQFGKFFYESLVHLLRPEDRSFENIWQIHEAQGYMVFRSSRMLITVTDNKALTIPTTDGFDFSAVVNNRVFVKDGPRLSQIDLTSMEMKTVLETSQFGGEQVLALLPGNTTSEIIAFTKQGGFYRMDDQTFTPVLQQRLLPENSNNLLTSAIRGSNGQFFLGTLRSKVIALGKSGERIETSAAFNAIQDYTVLNLFESLEGNIWVLLNNGIDCIDFSSPLTSIFQDASVYDVAMQDNKMYVATNQGLIVSSEMKSTMLSSGMFTSVPGLEGQAWSLQKFEDRLMCSHDRGLFVLDGNQVKQIDGVYGVWKVIALRDKPNNYFACTYDGIFLLRWDPAQGFTLVKRVDGFSESSRDILQSDEPGTFWICHGYKGVFKIKVDETFSRVLTLEHFVDQNGLPSPFNVNVTRWNDETVFTSNNGIFTYDKQEHIFKPHRFLNELFGTDKNVRKILQVKDRTWFVHDNEVGYFTDQSNSQLVKGYFLQLKGSFNASMECIVPLNENTVLLGTNSGLFAFDLNFSPSHRKAVTQISSVKYNVGQQESFAPIVSSKNSLQRFSHDVTGLEFSFSAPGFQDKLNIAYSFWLEGAEKEWSTWTGSSVKEYSLLPPGQYTFHVKAQSLLGERSEETLYAFQILPAWYQSKWAIMLYVILGMIALVFAYRVVRRRIRYENQKSLSEEKEKRKVLELELQRIRLQQEKDAIKKDKDILEEDVIFKSKELANYTMLLVKKRDLLNVMHDELKELKDAVKNETGRQKVRELIKKINTNLQDEEHIKVFEANFERVHSDFFARLKSAYPDLTTKEQQLCAFVKMNLTNKEIASILNISVRGVETARYRLRKRLAISPEEDMVGFLEKLYSSKSEPVEDHP